MAQVEEPRMPKLLDKVTIDGESLYEDLASQYSIANEVIQRFALWGIKSDRAAKALRVAAEMAYAQNEVIGAYRLYNSSLCFTEKNSPILGYTFLERSKCFSQFKWYDDALEDVRLAKEKYAEHDSFYLTKRYNDIIKKRKEAKKRGLHTERRFRPRVRGASLNFAPDSMEFEPNGKAIHPYRLVARKNFNVGEVIMIEKNYLKVTEPIFDNMQQCMHCGAEFVNLIPCSRCTFGLLCTNDECQKSHNIVCGINICTSDYGRRFRFECEFVIRAIEKGLELFHTMDSFIVFVQDAMNVRYVPVVPECVNDETDALKKYRTFLRLYRCRPDISQHRDLILQCMYYSIVRDRGFIRAKVLNLQHERFLMHLICHHAAQFTGYAMCIPSLGIVAHFFDHDCIPNVMLQHYNGETHAITTRQVYKEEALTISFGFPMVHNNVAHHVFSMNMLCGCIRCNAGLVRSSKSISIDPRYDKHIKYRREWASAEDIELAIEDAKDMSVEYEYHWGSKEYPAILQLMFEGFAAKYHTSPLFVR